MKFLFVSLVGDGLALARRLLDEGHELKFFVHEKKLREIGTGLVPKILAWQKYVNWADVIVFDDVYFGKEIDRLRRRAYRVAGGNAFGDRLENDRFFSNKIMRQLGMTPPKLRRFRDFAKAIRFIKQNPDVHVLKFNGGLAARHSSYVGRSPDASDLLGLLEHHRETWPSSRNIDFVLQKCIRGIEVTIGAFFNGKDFVMPTSVIFEHKRLFNKDIGPNTFQMGTVLFYPRKPTKIFKRTLQRMRPLLAATNYRGFIELNSIVNRRGVFPLEFSSRFGYPMIELVLHKMKWGKFLFDLADGRLGTFHADPRFALGVVMGGAGMPYENSYRKYGRRLPVMGLEKQNRKYVLPGQVRKIEGKYYTAGDYGHLFTAVGVGKTIAEAKTKAHNVIKKIVVPNAVYRTDIGDWSWFAIKKLRTLGLL